MKTKNIIQRALPLNVKYTLLSVNYLSLENGGGCSCNNCGKLITNVATVKSDKIYNIGLDCLDALLENNNLLEHESYIKYIWSDKPAINKAKSLRVKLLKKAKEDISFRALYREFEDGMFGFSYEVDRVKTFKLSEDRKSIIDCEPYTEKDPQGFDYTFQPEYKELTLNYLKGLTNVVYN